MNYFAIAVCVLQFGASVSYFLGAKYYDASLWVLYMLINIILIVRAEVT